MVRWWHHPARRKLGPFRPRSSARRTHVPLAVALAFGGPGRLRRLPSRPLKAGPVALTSAEEAWLAPSLAQAARGELAPDEEVAAVLARPGP